MARKPKPDPRRSDNKTNSNQSSGSVCPRCGGEGTATDGSGNTVSMSQDCPSCN